MSTQNWVVKYFSGQRLLLLLFCIGFAAIAGAQVSTGQFSGRVTDPSGAVVPNAKVVIENTATSVAKTVTTNSAGLYAVPSLNPGQYDITVSAPGFVTSKRAGLTLQVGAHLAINFKLQVGAVQKTVTVTGAAPMIQTTNSTISAVVNESSVQQLPLNGRSWSDLAALQPGVDTVHTQPGFQSGGDRGNRGFGQQMTISGQRPQMNNYLLDGVSMNDYANGAPGSVLGGNLGVDAIREFSVLTSNYSAQYGKTAGGVVNAVTRSGTNQFHGAVYEFLRNDKLDAANYFENGKRSPFRRNQFGADLGGPIVKNKTFFFGDYEGVRQAEGISQVDKVPSLAARAGNLSTGTVKVTPGAQAYLALYPKPNQTCAAGQDVCTFAFSGQQVVNENFFTTRIDQTFSGKDSLYGTLMYDRTPYNSPDAFNNMKLESLTDRQIVAIQETHTFSASLINAVRFGFNREYVEDNATASAINPAAANPALASFDFPNEYAANVTVSGISGLPGGLGALSTYYYHWKNYQVYDDANYLHGTHNVKFGLYWERDLLNYTSGSDPNGKWNFNSLQDFLTGTPSQFQGGVPSSLTPRDMRLNIFGVYAQDDWQVKPSLTLNLGMRYEMSTVPTEANGKIINLNSLSSKKGICGTYVPAYCTGTGALFNNPTLFNFEPRFGFAWSPLSSGKLAVRGGVGMFDAEPLLYAFDLLVDQAAPFFQYTTVSNLSGVTFPKFPTSLIADNTLRSTYIPRNPSRSYVIQYNLNVQYQVLPSMSMTVAYLGSEGIHTLFHGEEMLGIIPSPTSAGGGFIWPKVDIHGNLWNPTGGCDATSLSQTDPSSCVPSLPFNTNYGSIRGAFWNGRSYYNALEVHVIKRMTHGIQVGASYTFGKSIDTGSNAIAGDMYSNSVGNLPWWNMRINRGLSDFNVKQNLVINALWHVPGLKGGPAAARWVTNGWELGGIWTASSGVPFTPSWAFKGNPQYAMSPKSISYPDINRSLPGCGGSLVNPGNPNHYFDTSCFTLPQAPSQAYWNANCDPAPPSLKGTISGAGLPPLTCFNLRGNSGRNILIGPGINNVDFSIYKNNYIRSISENFNIQFRAEFFNIANHADFQVPSYHGQTDIFNAKGQAETATAGVLTSTSVPQREIQFALKVSF